MKKTFLVYLMIICSMGAAFAQESKKISILGDSYSTFDGCLQPSTNATWYHINESNPERTDVATPEQTWWSILLERTGSELERNNSFSGATVCHRGYNGQDFSSRSFITRMSDLGNPDIILVFGATNDAWAGVALTPETDEKPEPHPLYTFKPAMEYMLQQLGAIYPKAKTVFILNDGIKEEVRQIAIKACDDYSVPCVVLEGIEKMTGHPDRKGMRQIADQVEKKLKEEGII